MSLRTLLNTKVEPKRIPVEFEEQTYFVTGMPDSYYLNLQMMEEHKKLSIVKLWNTYLKQRGTPGEFTTDDVFNVLLVTHYLEDGEEIGDIDVAVLSKERGLLFGKLFAAALQIVGNTDSAQPVDAAVAVGLGNSGAVAQDASASSSPASPPAESTQPF